MKHIQTVVNYLFINTPPAQIICPVAFVRFAEKWIKWFTGAITSG